MRRDTLDGFVHSLAHLCAWLCLLAFLCGVVVGWCTFGWLWP
jgi:hypothetical protein